MPGHSGSLWSVSDTPEVSEDPTSTPKNSIMSRFLKPAKGKPRSSSAERPEITIIPVDERAAAMKTIEPNEVKLGWAASVVGALFALGLNLPFIFSDHTVTLTKKAVKGACSDGYVLHKGICETTATYSPQVFSAWLLAEVLIILAVVAAVHFRRRVPLAFFSMFLGVAFANEPPSHQILIGAPFLFFGGWVFLRARRIQKFGTTDSRTVALVAAENRKARKEGRPPSTPTSTGTRSASARSTSRSKSKTPATKAIESGRYTPKRPAPKKPTTPEPPKNPSGWKARLAGLGDEG